MHNAEIANRCNRKLFPHSRKQGRKFPSLHSLHWVFDIRFYILSCSPHYTGEIIKESLYQ